MTQMNTSQNNNDSPLRIVYNNGFHEEHSDYEKNDLTSWKVVKAQKDQMEVQLKFSDPIFVSSAEIKCGLVVYFSGKDFKSAGFGNKLS